MKLNRTWPPPHRERQTVKPKMKYKVSFYMPSLGFVSFGKYPSHRAACMAIHKRGPYLKARCGFDGFFPAGLRGDDA